MKTVSLILASCILLCGCVNQVTILDPATPLKLEGKSTKTIILGKVTIENSLIGKDVGSYHSGFLNIPFIPYTGEVGQQALGEVSALLENELKSSGYSVIESQNKVFNTEKADYLLDGTMVDLIYNGYDSIFSVRSEACAKMKWNLTDQHNSVVYEKETMAKTKGPLNNNSYTDSIKGAVRGSLMQVLADEKFIKYFRNE